MPVKRRYDKHRQVDLTPGERAWLRGEAVEDEVERYAIEFGVHGLRLDRPTPAELVRAFGDDFLPYWVRRRPGTRPDWWWTYHSPTARRQRLGGIGTPRHEWSAYVPEWRRGVPAFWFAHKDADEVSPHHASYDHPPLYEAQASFLRRTARLLNGELELLTEDDFRPEAVTR